MRKPDLKGRHGRAWRVAARTSNPDQAATLEAWLVSGSFHPAWSYWLVGAVHLRDLPLQSRRPQKQFAAATHEFLIVSLQSPPLSGLTPDPDDPETIRPLEPPDVVQQFVGTDAEAMRLVKAAVEVIVLVGESPDSDHRGWWQRAVPRTLEHFRFGRHPE